MFGEGIVLDPATESATNAPLWLHQRSNGSLSPGVTLSADGGHQYPTPDPDDVWVSSPETEGELRGNTRPQRRTITVTLQVVEPTDPGATNKATNPSAQVNTTGWTNNSLTLFERQTTLPARLDGFDTAIHATGNADDDSTYLSASVTNGVTETFSAWVYVVTGTVRLEVWNATPALSVSGSNILAGSWQRVALPFTPGATNTWTFRVAQNGAGTSEFYVTGVQIGPADPYFSGDTPGCYWTGTRGASASVRRTPGGERYDGIKVDIEDKIAKLNQFGGTYRRTLPSGETITFDVQAAQLASWQEDPVAETFRYTKCQISFTCKPYGRGGAVTV
jgi:hypothetical protein